MSHTKTEKRCILTITRPNGATRSYTSKPEFARKAAARAAAASVAVDMGAIDFIKHGSPDAVVKRGLVLAPLDAPGSVQAPLPSAAEEDLSVQEIEKCCVEWRAGRVKPRVRMCVADQALAASVPRVLGRRRLCHVRRSQSRVRRGCDCRGILDFIKFGNGQTVPAERRLFAQPEPEDEEQSAAAPPPIALTLQGFFEALPRPLPEPVDNKTVGEINAPGWLNMLIQSTRGGKLELKFIWTTDTKLGTHGAVLRLTRPGEVRTYMVDPQFAKRVDAKSAVCLAALAAGVGHYVRGIGAVLDAKISPEAKSLVFDCIFPLLLTEYAKFWPNKPPEMFDYTKDRDACGCILTLKLTAQPEEHEKRSWTVPAEYCNRNDAKVAVVQLAFEQGAIEFLRFSGEPPPEGYKVELPPPREAKKAKRKATDDEDGNPKKKPKLLSQTVQFLAATGPPKSTPVVLAPTTTQPPMFIPRPGYVDSKPEPGELPDEPPVAVLPRRPAVAPAAPFQQRTTRELRPALEPRGQPYDYGHQYELGVGGARYDDTGDAYPADPYYAPTPPPPPGAPHTEPWHAARAYPRPEGHDDEYHRRAYYANDYSGYGYDYDYARRYTPPPPEPTYDGLPRRSGGYDDAEYAYAHAYTRRTQQRTTEPTLLEPPPPPPQPSPPLDLVTSQRRAPPQSPPRVWQPGPRAAKLDAVSTSAAPPSISTSSASSTHHLHSKAPTPVPELITSTYTPSCKEELIEYCKAAGHPCPRFFDTPLDEAAMDTANSRYKVWIVLGQERLELPAAYAKVEDGEEKLARKVLQRLRAQDAGKAKRGAE
ncbi:hypothetical protein EI94DRAFT_1911940 [Lactarius quietus]|nr:hypothetical protein EI94DRAFT_1911940 [Lactarius quietus]